MAKEPVKRFVGPIHVSQAGSGQDHTVSGMVQSELWTTIAPASIAERVISA